MLIARGIEYKSREVLFSVPIGHWLVLILNTVQDDLRKYVNTLKVVWRGITIVCEMVRLADVESWVI